MRRKGSKKPAKPYLEFPLHAHSAGQWAKEIRGSLHYFGPWDQPELALRRYLRDRDYLYSGVEPPVESATVGNLLDSWLGRQQLRLELDEITDVTWGEYEATCDVVAAALGRHRTLATLDHRALGELRVALAQGKTKKLGPVTHKRRLTIARMIFKHAALLGQTVHYASELRSPPARSLRQARNASGLKLFTAEQIRQIVDAAGAEMKAMTLLGINCAFGPGECCGLPLATVDLNAGWHSFPRPKTEVARRAPLWPETVRSMQRLTPTNGRFLTDWNRHRIADEFRKLVDDFYVKNVTAFYTLRRTFETIAATADVPQPVIDCIMGHARQDMASIYRQKVFDKQLRTCSEHVRQWFLGRIVLE